MKYRCRILFTTRSRFNNYISMTLEEIADTEALVGLMGCFYSDAEKYRPVLEQIIQTVHSHTLAVEMSARLLETGIMEPMLLLNKLKEEKVGLDATDTIGITKDGKSQKATYYHHIRTLFSLYHLSDTETEVMRSLSLFPVTGISGRLFANWMKFRDMNTVNALIEKGFVQAMEGHVIALHPLIQEVAIEEVKPSVNSCRTLLDGLQQICLRHGEEKPDKAIKLAKDAVAMLTDVTSDNALLAANLHANLGGMYRQSGKYELAKQYMEQGIQLLERFGLVPYHDSIPQITNYAVLLTEMGQPDIGLSALRKLSRVIREYNSEQTIDYASVQERWEISV